MTRQPTRRKKDTQTDRAGSKAGRPKPKATKRGSKAKRARPAVPPGHKERPAGKAARKGDTKSKRTTKGKADGTKRKATPARRRGKPGSRRNPVKVIPDHLVHGAERTTGKAVKQVKPTKGKSTRRAKRTPIQIGGHKVEKGTTANILLKISEHYTHQGVYIPVTVIRGQRPGPRLFLTAAVHGDEINGVQIIREVIDQIDPQQLKGTVVAVPVVNRFGFVSHSRYMPDRRDLNRGFPGDPQGSTTARVAHVIHQEIVAPCDYGIDLHTAGYQRHNLPQIRGDMNNDEVRRIARAFGAEVILDTRGLKGTLRRTASESGVPTIIYEAGETFRFQRDEITKGVRGCLNVMRELKMLTGTSSRPPYQVIVKTSEWVRAGHGGIMETVVDAGDLVFKGETIAHIANPFGRTVDEVVAPFDGIVVGVTMLPMVHPGTPVCHMVKLKKTLATVAKHHGVTRVEALDQDDLDDVTPSHRLEEEDDVDG